MDYNLEKIFSCPDNKQLELALHAAFTEKRDIDITDNIALIDRENVLKGYDVARLCGITIYDKTGFNIKKYKIRSRIAEENHLCTSIANNVLSVDVDIFTDFDVLEQHLTKNYDQIILRCNGIFIPPIFKNTYTSKMILVDSVFEYNFLASIPCHDIVISGRNAFPSYHMMKCRVFSLSVDHIDTIPMMPENAVRVSLNSNFTRDMAFTGNENIEKLTIIGRTITKCITLMNLPSLISLTTTETILVPNKVMTQLKELNCSGHNMAVWFASFEQKDDNVLIIMSNSNLNSKLGITLSELESFTGTIMTDEVYLMMPNLKKLHTTRVVKLHCIPKDIEEVKLDLSYLHSDVISFEKHLIEHAKSIRYMTLHLSDISHDYPIESRGDIYYDIRLKGNVRIFQYNSILRKSAVQLDEALLSNKRFVVKNRTLLSYL